MVESALKRGRKSASGPFLKVAGIVARQCYPPLACSSPVLARASRPLPVELTMAHGAWRSSRVRSVGVRTKCCASMNVIEAHRNCCRLRSWCASLSQVYSALARNFDASPGKFSVSLHTTCTAHILNAITHQIIKDLRTVPYTSGTMRVIPPRNLGQWSVIVMILLSRDPTEWWQFESKCTRMKVPVC